MVLFWLFGGSFKFKKKLRDCTVARWHLLETLVERGGGLSRPLLDNVRK